MNPIELNPTGNVFDRFKAAWFIFWFPHEVCGGIAQAVVAQAYMRAIAKQALAATAPADAATEAPAPDLPETLARAATAARSEAVNG